MCSLSWTYWFHCVSHTVPFTIMALTLLLIDFLCWLINFANVQKPEPEFIIFSTLSTYSMECSRPSLLRLYILSCFSSLYIQWVISICWWTTFFHSHNMYFDLFVALSIIKFQILYFDVLSLMLSLCPGALPTTALFNIQVKCPSAHKHSNSVSYHPVTDQYITLLNSLNPYQTRPNVCSCLVMFLK